MTILSDILEEIKDGQSARHLDHMVCIAKVYFPSDEESKMLALKFGHFLRTGRIGRATSFLIAGLLFDHNRFIRNVRRRGLLRSSLYGYQAKNITSVIKNVIASNILLPLETLKYLHSVLVLCTASDDVHKINRNIKKSLQTGGSFLLWKLLAELNFLFLQRQRQSLSSDLNPNCHEASFWGLEELAEGYSYLYSLIKSDALGSFPKTKESIFFADSLLTDACLVRSFSDFEFMIDLMGYNATTEGSNSIRMLPPNESCRIAFAIGEFKGRMREISLHHQYPSGISISLAKMGKDLCNALHDKEFKYDKGRLPRYTANLLIPKEILEWLREDRLFTEEIVTLTKLEEEQFADFSKIIGFEVSNGVTLGDLLKADRVFVLLYSYLINYLEPRMKSEREAVTHSLLLDRSKDEMIKLLGFAVGDKAEKVLNFLTWLPNDEQAFDLQTQPIVKWLNDVYTVPLSIVCSNNIFRNSLSRVRQRFFEDGTQDPLCDELFAKLTTRTYRVKKNLKYDFEGKEREIDVLAVIGEEIFIFECKNALAPGNLRQCKTTFDYIEKASSQLDNFLRALRNETYREKLEKKIGWKFPPLYRPATGIIISNRTFSGYRHNGHPVRGSGEILTQIEDGVVSLNGKQICLWPNGTFTGEHLWRYLEEDTLHCPYLQATFPLEQDHRYGEKNILFTAHYVETETLQKNFRTAYGIDEISELHKTNQD